MGDEQRGELEVGEDVGELVAHLPAGDRVERAERLVEQQHARVACERARERDALALAAGELPGTGGGEVPDPESLEQVGAVALAGEAHVRGDRQVREQPVVLREVADATALGAEVDTAGRRRTTARDPSAMRPRAAALESGDRAQQRGLAGAGGSDERDRLGAEAQRGAKIERSPREGDVDVEEVHERTSSFEASRIAALTIISSTPIATA